MPREGATPLQPDSRRPSPEGRPSAYPSGTSAVRGPGSGPGLLMVLRPGAHECPGNDLLRCRRIRCPRRRKDGHLPIRPVLRRYAVLVVALVFSWSSGPVPMNAPGMIYFAAAGFAAPFAGRTAIFLSVRNIGATRSASLAMSESLFAAALAYAILGQRVSAVTVAGIFILVAATVLFINETSRTFPSLAPSESPAGTETVPAGGDWAPGGTKAGVFFGFSAGFFFAVAGIFRQLGVDAIPSALLGSVVGTSVALVVVIIQPLQHGSLRNEPCCKVCMITTTSATEVPTTEPRSAEGMAATPS